MTAPPDAAQAAGRGAVLVCGLGSLGVECVTVLRRYGVAVRAIDLVEPLVEPRFDPQVEPPVGGATFVRGDCRRPEVLRQAGIESCRAVVLVTGDPHANVEAALATRKLNPGIRIVARAAQDNVNQLLTTLLGNFVAYEPSRLAAGALALAAARGEVIGYFRVEGRLVRVLRRRVDPDDRWQGADVRQLGRHGLFVLDHVPQVAEPARAANLVDPSANLFHGHDPGRAIEQGDMLTLLSVEHDAAAGAPRRAPARRTFADRLADLRRSLRRPAGVVLASLAAVALALTVAAIAFPSGERSLSTVDGLFTALVLMTGGTYADLFPPFNHLSNSLRLLSIGLSATGTLFVGLLYAGLTERLMTLRLRLGRRRPPVPRHGHVVVVGLGRGGRHATGVLEELEHPVAAIEIEDVGDHSMPQLPVVSGNGVEADALAAANIAGARAVLATTRDEWVNLEIALQVRRLNADCELVIRTHDTRFSRNIADIVPHMRALCVPEVAARAFAAAALGGKVLDLFQLDERTVFVVEHEVAAGDGLEGRFLAEAAEGYSVVPVWYTTRGHAPRFWTPADPVVRLAAGDRVVLLGPSRSLRWIERAQMHPRGVTLRLVARRPYADEITVASVLAQHTGCTLEAGRQLLRDLPRDLPDLLYTHQAHRLRAALQASGTTVELYLSCPPPPPSSPASAQP
jgi:Trk K+ transport system NAD-binding subunit